MKYVGNILSFRINLFLAKDLIRATQSKNEQLVNNIIDGLIDLRNTINRKEIPQNENPNKLVSIVQKVLNFHGQQKSKGIEILNFKPMFHRLPITLVQVEIPLVIHLKTY